MERHRIDHWLKLVCLFKQRTEATDACKGGLVKLNGQRVKPSAPVHEGDVIEFLQGDRPRRVVISALPAGSVSKEVARTMYVDESPLYERPERVPPAARRDPGSGRPTKRDRREMEEWRRR
ncbi:MAG: RNA-binding S4 domain-containing protein [Thermoanaerobaculia bacterium]|nr:RNA-binding S4 domain-containing protein [Thermoanaerobaculia bacterium]